MQTDRSYILLGQIKNFKLLCDITESYISIRRECKFFLHDGISY